MAANQRYVETMLLEIKSQVHGTTAFNFLDVIILTH